MKNMPVYFIPHGGGPWHVMDDAMGDPAGTLMGVNVSGYKFG
ncbi:hypothetical protein NC99_03930 [Sunxiuqinia dokdonensis]|uniref:Dioxygenase n=1 Tax=Sunxiuqinia dokdonensis TaxID=1409788 RepID=A0A0L8VF68_9BACT|nr:hypothetical protein NC99_03930 [Sunxiuqinia dokdonensis]